MNKVLALIGSLIVATSLQATSAYTINIDQPENEVVKGQLDMGGANPAGVRIDVNNYYIEQAGKPLFPLSASSIIQDTRPLTGKNPFLR